MKHYIYAHLDKGEPVYIGIGVGERAWRTTGRNNPEHKEWLKSKLPEHLELQFIATNITKQDGYHLESYLISLLKPKFNDKIARAVKDGTGKEYISARHASKLLGLPYTTIATRCCNNYEGWRYVN